MASGTQQHQHQQQHQQGQHQQQDLPLPQQHDNQMQFVSNQSLNTCYDSPQVNHIDTMSPIASTPMSIDQTHGHMAITSTQRQPNRIMDPLVSNSPMDQEMCNQISSEHHLQTQPQQQQKSHLLPLLLSPQPTGHKFPDRTEQSENDHDQIIEQAISLEDEYSDPSVTMSNVDNSGGLVMSNQAQHYLMSDTNLANAQCVRDGNQLSTSAEDLLNLLSEFDRDSSNLVGGGQQLDQDEKVGIETIRKQLMSCEAQSDQLLQQNTNNMSPVLNQLERGQSTHTDRTTHQSHHNLHQQQVAQRSQLISQTAPVIPPHKQSQHHISSPGLSQQQRQAQLSHHHRLSVDQTMLQSPYSNSHLGPVPVSSSGQPYNPHQHQSLSRISQSTPMSVDNNSPSPSWQQPQLSPFSPQSTHNDLNGLPQTSQLQQHPTIQQTHLIHQQQQQHPTTATSPQIQQLHHPMQRISPSQSISPPATTEPSPVVKKNPLLNAQLVNSRAPSMTPSRFMNSQASVLNQNPILNSKLSQNLYVTSSCGPTGNPVDSSLTQQNRFIRQQQQQPHQQSNFNYDITQQQQNVQQHVSPQPGQYMSMYGHNEHPQQQQQHQQHTNQMFRTSTVTTTASSSIPPRWVPQMTMGSTSPSGGLSQQVKQEIRKKVQQPKQQHQTTSLLKQLLSDDNK